MFTNEASAHEGVGHKRSTMISNQSTCHSPNQEGTSGANGSLHGLSQRRLNCVCRRRARSIPETPHALPQRRFSRILVSDVVVQQLLCHEYIMNPRNLCDTDGKLKWKNAVFLSTAREHYIIFQNIACILFRKCSQAK